MGQARGLLEATNPAPPQTHLVIGDAHSDPLAPNDRFTWLGRLIVDLKPDVVVDMGDWATLGSLYQKDWGKMRGEGKRLADDIAFARDARERVNRELAAYNKGRRSGSRYTPHLIAIQGNHEDRINTLIHTQPHLYDHISTSDLGYDGWEVVPFLVPRCVGGIWYQHYWSNGMGKAVSSEKHHAAALLDKGLVSCVQGHSHRYDLSIRQRWDGTKAMGLVAGCYFDHIEPWAGPDNSRWDRGLVLIRDVQNGFGHAEWISFDRVKRTYGG